MPLPNYEGTVNVNRSKNSIEFLGIYYRSVPAGQRRHRRVGDLNKLECGYKERCLEFHVWITWPKTVNMYRKDIKYSWSHKEKF